jgi:hypothetical protein
MATRKVKDAKENITGELIYFKGHAEATYMSDGSTVENKVNSKQDKLISGSNIKTINGTSILGDGNVKLGSKQIVTTTASTIILTSNVYYKKTNVSNSLTIVFDDESDTTIMNEYFIEFTTASTGTSVTLPNTVKWIDGVIPTFENNCTYQISVVNNLGICSKFK